MKVIGWIGILHVAVLVIWMIINIVFSYHNPVTVTNEVSLSEIGLTFYSNFPGYLGFDHGSKALIMLSSILLPIGLFMYLKKLKDFQLQNIIALISGCLGFAMYGLSLMLQAVAVEYAFNLYRTSEDAFAHSFALYLYEWAMLEGGLSVSIYIIANLFLACWVILHSLGLYKRETYKKVGMFGMTIGSLQAIGYFIAWFYLMQAHQAMHDINEAVGLLLLVWISLISIKMVQGKIAIE